MGRAIGCAVRCSKCDGRGYRVAMSDGEVTDWEDCDCPCHSAHDPANCTECKGTGDVWVQAKEDSWREPCECTCHAVPTPVAAVCWKCGHEKNGASSPCATCGAVGTCIDCGGTGVVTRAAHGFSGEHGDTWPESTECSTCHKQPGEEVF